MPLNHYYYSHDEVLVALCHYRIVSWSLSDATEMCGSVYVALTMLSIRGQCGEESAAVVFDHIEENEACYLQH